VLERRAYTKYAVSVRRFAAAACWGILTIPSAACEAPDDEAKAAEAGTDDTGDADLDTGESETGEDEAGYPSGPYGMEVGDVVENLSFVDRDAVTVTLEQLRAEPQRGLLLFGTAAWCAVCIAEAEELTLTLADQSETLLPVGVLYEDALAGPPTAELAAGYNDSVDAFEFVADPSQRFNDYFDPSGQLPRLLLIDTATMTLVYKSQGLDEAALLDAIAAIPAG
jgi:hypothetical protein